LCLLLYTTPPLSLIYTLSLHDTLPICSFLLNCKENSELTTLADPKNINQKNAATPVNNNASTPATKMVNKMFILSSFGSSRLALRIHMNNDTKEMINITETSITNNMI